MKHSILAIAVALIFLSALSCQRENFGLRDGAYTGTFTVDYHISVWDTTMSGPVTVTFDGDRFLSTGNANHVPEYAAGRFAIDEDSIYFQDSTFHTLDFDGELWLWGSYAYELKPRQLRFWKEPSGSLDWKYEYVLRRE